MENHVRWMNKVLTELEIEETLYVGQDWGGPIGMGALAESPDLLKGAVILNTGFTAPTEDMELSSAHAMVRTPVVGELLLSVAFSILNPYLACRVTPTQFHLLFNRCTGTL